MKLTDIVWTILFSCLKVSSIYTNESPYELANKMQLSKELFSLSKEEFVKEHFKIERVEY